MTDELSVYPEIGTEFASHDAVKHSEDEYVRYEGDKALRPIPSRATIRSSSAA
jgi:hypothetical protein